MKKLFGYNAKKHRQEDMAFAEAHRTKQEQHWHSIIAEEKALREAARKRAEAELEKARKAEDALHTEIEAAYKELSLNENKLVDAKAKLAKASNDLKRLDSQKLEIVSTIPTNQWKKVHGASYILTATRKRFL